MGVVVRQTNGLNYKAHKILFPDGTVFDLTETADQEPAQGAPTKGWLVTLSRPAVSGTVTQPDASVKQNSPDDLPLSIGGAPDGMGQVEVTDENGITVDSTDEERYNALNKKSIHTASPNERQAAVVAEEIEAVPENSIVRVNAENRAKVKSAIKAIARKLQIPETALQNDDVPGNFSFSIRHLDKSANHQTEYAGTVEAFAKAISCIDDLARNAVLIETHAEKKTGTPKENPDLKQVYVLVSAMETEIGIVPVQLEVQEYFKNPMGLYMAVALGEIKKPEVGNAPTLTVTDEAATHLFPGSGVSLQYLFANVNRDDSRLCLTFPSCRGSLIPSKYSFSNSITSFFCH